MLRRFSTVLSTAILTVLSTAILIVSTQTSSADAVNASVIYAFTSDDLVLNNPNGTWGGTLNVGAGQNVNVTVEYTFWASPNLIDTDEAEFDIWGLQVFDNTNGLESGLLDSTSIGGLGQFLVRYDGIMDHQFGAGFGFPAGGSFVSTATGEFGDAGDPLPMGSAFDTLIENAFLYFVIARTPDHRNDNISGQSGASLQPGNFTFESRLGPLLGPKVAPVYQTPIPATFPLLASGLVGLGLISWRKRKAA
jgi:hypothetical protein